MIASKIVCVASSQQHAVPSGEQPIPGSNLLATASGNRRSGGANSSGCFGGSDASGDAGGVLIWMMLVKLVMRLVLLITLLVMLVMLLVMLVMLVVF